MSFEEAETRRKQGNMLKYGTIVSVEGDRAVVSIDYGNGVITTAPIPWSERAGKSRTWAPPAPGQQVLVAAPSGDPANGIIVASAYNAASTAPSDRLDVTRTVFGDGSEITVDESGALMTIKAAGDLTIECAGILTLRGAELRLN